MVELLSKIEKSFEKNTFHLSFNIFNRQRIENGISTYSFFKIVKLYKETKPQNINDDGWVKLTKDVSPKKIKKTAEGIKAPLDKESVKTKTSRKENDKSGLQSSKPIIKNNNRFIYLSILAIFSVLFVFYLLNKFTPISLNNFSKSINESALFEYNDINKYAYVSAPIDANVRSTPNTDEPNNIVTTLSRGDKVFLIAQHNESNWYKIKYNERGDEAFISHKLINDNTPSGILEHYNIGYALNNVSIKRLMDDETLIFNINKGDSLFVEYENIERGYFRVHKLNNKDKRGFVSEDDISFTKPSNKIIDNNLNAEKQKFIIEDSKIEDNKIEDKSKETSSIKE